MPIQTNQIDLYIDMCLVTHPILSFTGDLYNDHEEAESSDGSMSSPRLRVRSGASKRLSSRLRNRMCRSLGASLDQLSYEDARGTGRGSEAARLNRLHLISSSLSLHPALSSSSLSSCSTPPRCHSFTDLVEGTAGITRRRSLPSAHDEDSSSRVRLFHEYSNFNILCNQNDYLWVLSQYVSISHRGS